jgi:hypothetical protein
MNCFYHPGVAAVGICKSCSKGICPECNVDLGDGLACKGRCEEKAKALIQFIDESVKRSALNRQIIDSAKSNRFISAIFPMVMGLFFLGFGGYIAFTTSFDAFNLFLPGLGTLFLAFGLFSLYRAITFGSKNAR